MSNLIGKRVKYLDGGYNNMRQSDEENKFNHRGWQELIQDVGHDYADAQSVKSGTYTLCAEGNSGSYPMQYDLMTDELIRDGRPWQMRECVS